MDFCPDCETKMIPLKKKQAKTVTLILSCQSVDTKRRQRAQIRLCARFKEHGH